MLKYLLLTSDSSHSSDKRDGSDGSDSFVMRDLRAGALSALTSTLASYLIGVTTARMASARSALVLDVMMAAMVKDDNRSHLTMMN